MNLEEGQSVMCTVTKIVGTTVFVKIEGNGEGTIVTSEIAPGRIRNLRDYVIPNKKIVCKILRIEGGNFHLSLRRVSTKEKKEVEEKFEKERSIEAALKTIVNDSERIKKIREKTSLFELAESARENHSVLNEFFSEEEAAKFLKILKEKKEKEIFVRKKFSMTCEGGDGILRIKKTLPSSASYLGAGKFSLEIKEKGYKEANAKMLRLLQEMEKKSKENSCVFVPEK